MIKLSKVFLVDIAPSTGAATVTDAEYDPATGLVHYDGKVTHISRVREATLVRDAVKQPVTPAPIVRKAPPRKP